MATPLADRHCVVCKPGTPTLAPGAMDAMLDQLSGWTVAEVGDHLELTMPGVELINAIAPLAEAEGHHPDLHLSYGSLRVDLWTHAAHGLTENDFILASKIEQIAPA